MLKLVRFFVLILSLICISLVSANATHLRAGDITIERQSPFGYYYKVILHIYTRMSSPVKFGGGTLNFGDNSKMTTPVGAFDNPPAISDADGGIGYVEYAAYHNFPGPGRYTISYTEANRNGGILNLGGASSEGIAFSIQTQFRIDDLLPGGADNSPELLVPPIDMGCTGVAWFHNPGAFDRDGDSLSYKIIVPKKGPVYDKNGRYVSSIDAPYLPLDNPSFSTVTELGTSPPVFKIDPVTGTITWDSPGRAGEYNIAFEIIEWRKINGDWRQIGYVERDMQIIIQACDNNRPKLQGVPDVCKTAGDTVKATVFATDPAVNPGHRTTGDGTAVKLEAFSYIFGVNPSPATRTPYPPIWQPITNDTDMAQLSVTWMTQCAHVKEQPYEVIFKATDNGSPNLASFESWRIKIVAPPPNLITATLDSIKRKARLTWKKYACSNASQIQVWRRVGSAPYTLEDCVTGLPSYLGYQLIAQVPVDSAGYSDNNLKSGAAYCYRLVAIFPQPNGSSSYVSNELCIPPLATKAPIITKVTIDTTDVANGQITVKWVPPLHSKKTYPFKYEVYRAEGFSGKVNLVKATPGKITADSLIDRPLNTAQNIYNYRVVCYDSTGSNFLDSSAVASSVRLELKPSFQRILLNWSANVPWSNSSPDYPIHVIYRTTNSAARTVSMSDIIDTVFVNKSEFVYLDTGQYNHTPLSSTQEYCYAVMTQGSYGNPKIAAPLINFSEITCAIPDDPKKPCVPVLAVGGIDCKKYFDCPVIGSKFTNQIQWRRPSDINCRNEIYGYNVYAANSVGDSFVKIAQLVKDTFYVHSNLQSFAQCYKVSAVNRAGLESDLSAQFCFDNCPAYVLPNVFTPNGDNCNDTFSAYSLRHYGDDGPYPCGNAKSVIAAYIDSLQSKCARFVLSVNFKVYNRWGRQVYTYQGDFNDPESSPGIYIDWNGRDSDGRELDGGVYYYSASVVFDMVDPKNRNQTIKGWVEIIR